MSDDDLRRQLDALDEPGEEQQVPSWASSPLVKQLEQDGTIDSLTMRHRVQQDADRLEAIAKSRDHMGTMGKSWGILPDSDPSEAGLLEQAGNMLLGTARTKKEWAEREAKEIEADRGRVKQVEETTQRGAGAISRLFGAGVGEQIAGANVGTFGARQAERAETPEGRGERAIARREGTLARIQSGEDKGPMKTGLRSGVESFATGAIEALPAAAAKTIGIAYGYAARVVGSESPPDENLAYALGNWISAKGKELFPGDPRRQEEFTQKLSQGAGSMLGFMGPAVTARLLGASNDVLIKLAAIGGATAEGVETFEDASHSMKERPGEVTEWHRFAAWVAGLGLGVTEAAPIATLLKRRGGTYSGAIGREALEEGGQEMFQSIGEDVTARVLHDPSRQIGENALEAGAIGAILGGTIQGGRLAASRSARQQIRDEREPDAAKAQPAPDITQTPDLSAMAERQPRGDGEARSRPTQPTAPAETLPPDIAELVRKAAPEVAAKHGLAPSMEPDQRVAAETDAALDAIPQTETVSNPEQASATEGKPQQVEAEQPKSPEVTPTDVKSPDIEQLRAQLDKVNRKAKLAAVAEEMGLGLTDAQLGGKLTDIRAAILNAVEAKASAVRPVPQTATTATTAQQAQAQPAQAQPDTAQFREILRGTTSAKTWAKQLGITDAEMKPLVDRAVSAGLLRVSKDGIIRRTPKAKETGGDLGDVGSGEVRSTSQGIPSPGQPGDVRGTAGEQQARGALPGARRGGGGDAGAPRGADGGQSAGRQQEGGNASAERNDGRRAGEERSRLQRVIAESEAKIEAELRDRSARNYRITNDDLIGQGGPKAKVRANIEAIRVLRKLEDEKRAATDDEKRVLVKYVGWGAFAQEMFLDKKADWEKERKAFQELVSVDEYEAARRSTQNAHYTSPEVVRGMWAALGHLGFTGGRAIEPSAGVGHFIGMMPDGLVPRVDWTGVELDPITGGIARALYGGADIRVQGFETVNWPDGFFDLAISNVPFGQIPIRDKRYGKNYNIHDYFFIKALDKVRPGGIVAFITSSGTMDKAADSARREIAARANLLGAVRLPGGKKGAFAGNAGTEVTTDIIFLRKRMDGEPIGDQSWLELKQIKTKDGPHEINRYFAEHPDMMLGEMRLTGSMYGANEPVLVGSTENIEERIAAAVQKNMPAGAFIERKAQSLQAEQEAVDTATDGIKEGAYYDKGGALYRKVAGVGQPQKLSKADADKVRAFMGMRDIVNALLAKQARGDTMGLDDLRESLSKSYDAFVKKNGPINKTVKSEITRKDGKVITTVRRPNLNAFRDDPDAFKVAAIENYDDQKDTASKAAIFTSDVLGSYERPAISGPIDALAVSLNEVGRIDMPLIAAMLETSVEQAAAELGDRVYLNPNGDQWQTSDVYLSGDVVTKLEEARAAAAIDPKYSRNVSALSDVQPVQLTREDIHVPFGATWVPAEDYKQFLREVMGLLRYTDVDVKLNPVTKKWSIENKPAWPRSAIAQYGSEHKSVKEIVEAALNSTPVRVTEKVRNPDGSESTIFLPEATAEVQQRVRLLKQAWSGNQESGEEGWLWGNEERARRLEASYNATFNRLVPLRADGSHLSLPGLAKSITTGDGRVVPFSLRPHQKNAVWRTILYGNTLFDHTVGAGKTFTMVASAMEQKRLGLSQRPMVVVPNHMLDQFSREWLQAYPNAKLLIADKDSMSAAKRKEFAARVAAERWDGIIITHSAFGRIRMADESYRDFFSEQIDELQDAIDQEIADGTRKNEPTVKQLERMKDALKTKMDALINKERKDDGITFEELGVDQVIVDEAHLFKNLQLVTRHNRVKGLATSASQRATDLFLKIRHIEKMKPGRAAVFATGTPVSNTMAEMYTMQRYLQMGELKKYGIDKFDAWAATFGEITQQTELKEDGRSFAEITSFSRFVNIPELVQIYSRVADTMSADQLNLPRPKLKGGTVRVVEAEMSDEEEAYMASLIKRSEDVRGGKVKPEEDNMLKIMSEGRKLATDMRLLDASAAVNDNGKVARAVENILRIWRDGNKDKKAPDKAQIVFLDMGVPGRQRTSGTLSSTKTEEESRIEVIRAGIKQEAKQDDDETDVDAADAREDQDFFTGAFNLYDDIADRLVAGGVPRSQIAYIHDAKSDTAKASLFAKVRAGEVRVLIGSTGKMGVGTNVQTRLVAMHHIDAPWKPAEVEQRDGRIMRQGNLNPEIEIYRYITKKSLDAFMWQTLERKAGFIAQLRAGAKGIRTAEDIDNPLPEAAAIKAAASGDPRILEYAELTKEVKDLEAAKRAQARSTDNARRALAENASRIASIEKLLGKYEADAAKVTDTKGDKFAMSLNVAKGGPVEIKDRRKAADAIRDFVWRMGRNIWSSQAATEEVATLSGFAVMVEIHRTAEGVAAKFYIAGENIYGEDGKLFAVTETSDFLGVIRRIENMVQEVPVALQASRIAQDGYRNDMAKLERQSQTKPFAKEERLAEAKSRLEQIKKETSGENTAQPGPMMSFAGPMPRAEVMDKGQPLFSLAALRNGAKLIDEIGPNDPHPAGGVIAFHGTGARFIEDGGKFDVSRSADFAMHFGTREQANARMGFESPVFYGLADGERVIPVVLDLKNVVTLPDMQSWPVMETAKELESRVPALAGLTAEIQASNVTTRADADDILRQRLAVAGIDGIRYQNSVEGAGWSYMVWETGKVRSALSNVELMRLTGEAPQFSPQARARRKEITDAIGAEIKRMLPPNVAVKLADRVTKSIDGYTAEGYGAVTPENGGRFLMEIALRFGSEKALSTGRHETIHVLREMDLIEDAEWQLLLEEASRQGIGETVSLIDGMDAAAANEQYRTLYRANGISEGLTGKALENYIVEYVNQEKVARLAEMWETRPKTFDSKVQALFERIKSLIEAIANALRGLGFQNVNDVFERVFSGEVAARARLMPQLDPLPPGVHALGASVPPVPGFALPGLSGVIYEDAMSHQAMMAIRAFHGSPHDFDRFDMSRIGTGEGAQAYGHGLYFAEREGVARSYREKLTSPPDFVPHSINKLRHADAAVEVLQAVRRFRQEDPAYTVSELRDAVRDLTAIDKLPPYSVEAFNELLKAGHIVNPGRIYEVRINAEPDDFLEWGLPAKEQSAAVRAKLPPEWQNDLVPEYPTWMGYARTPEGAAKLREAGILGTKYLDQGSRAAGEGSRNYVVFDDSLVEIVAKDGKLVSREVKEAIREAASGDNGRQMMSFAGVLAKTADHDALSMAKQMEADGKSRDDIWAETGWFRGVDGKWRFEIDDSGVRLLDPTIIGDQFFPASEALRHKSLFDAYPSLGQAAVYSRRESGGLFRKADAEHAGAIMVGRYASNPTSIALHEVQHGIQDIEGLAKGGNDTIGHPRADVERMAREAYELNRGRQPDADDALLAELGIKTERPTKPWEELTQREQMEWWDAGRGRAYRHLAGEVEARTVQKRLDLTPDQRRARPPWLDYDVPEDQQIVRFASGGPMMSLASGDNLEISDKIENMEAAQEALESLSIDGRRALTPEYDVITWPSNGRATYYVVPKGEPLEDSRGDMMWIGRFDVKPAQRMEVAGVEVTNASVVSTHQRKGIASAVYDLVAKDMAGVGGLSPSPSDQLSPDGQAFWRKRMPGIMFALAPNDPPKIKALSDIIADLKEALGMPATQGRTMITAVEPSTGRKWSWRPQRNVRAQYDSAGAIARVKAVTDIESLAHEGGHHIERLFQGRNGSPLDQLKQDHADALRGFTAGVATTPENELSEGFAEFFRSYLLDPQKTRTQAPRLVEAFDDLLDGEMPAVLELLDRAQLITTSEDYQRYINASTTERATADLVSNADRSWSKWMQDIYDQMQQGDTISGWAHQVYSSVIDGKHPFYLMTRELLRRADLNQATGGDGRGITLAVHENPYKLIRSVGDAFKTGLRWIQDGIPNYRQFGTDDSFRSTSLHEALMTALGNKWTHAGLQRFGAYLESRRAVEEWRAYEEKLAEIERMSRDITGINAISSDLRDERRRLASQLETRQRRQTEDEAVERAYFREVAKLEAQQVRIESEIANGFSTPDQRKKAEDKLKLVRRSLADYNGRLDGLAERLGRIDAERETAEQSIEGIDRALQSMGTRLEQLRTDRQRRKENGAQRAPHRISRVEHEQRIKDFEASDPAFVQAAPMVYDFLWQQAVHDFQAGRLTQAELDYRETRKHFYVPFARDMSDIVTGTAGQGSAGQRFAKDKKFTGSSRNVVNPIETIVEQTFHKAAATHFNEAMIALANLTDQVGPGGAAIAERVTKQQALDANPDAFDTLRKAIVAEGFTEEDADEMVKRVESDFGDTQLLLQWSPEGLGPKRPLLIPIWENGQRDFIRINDPELAQSVHEAVNSVGREVSNIILKALAKPAQLLRIGATQHPAFIGFNMIRDMWMAFTLTGNVLDPRTYPVVTQVRGLWHELRQTEFARMYQETAGLMGGQNVAALGMVKDKKAVLELRERGLHLKPIPLAIGAGLGAVTGAALLAPAGLAALGGVAAAAVGTAGGTFGAVLGAALSRGPSRFFETMAMVADLSETATRLGVASHAYQLALKNNPSLTPYQAAQEAGYVARDVIDFGRHGSKALVATRLIAFFNAQVQGLDKAVRAIMARSDRGYLIDPAKGLAAPAAAGAAAGMAVAGPVGAAVGAFAGPALASNIVARNETVRALLAPMTKKVGNLQMSKDEEAALGDSARMWAGLMLYTGALLALAALYRDDEEYQAIDAQLKQKSQPIKLFGDWYVIPKAFEMGLPSTIIEAAIDAQYAKDTRFWERTRAAIADTLTPPLVPQSVELFRGLTANYDSFRQRPIVSESMQKLHPDQQFNAYTSALARKTAQSFNAAVRQSFPEDMARKYQISPMMVDFSIRSTLGYWGKDMQKAGGLNSDVGGRSGRLAEYPMIGTVVSRFQLDPYRRSDAVNEYWHQMGAINTPFQRAAAGYDNDIRRLGEPEANRKLVMLNEEQRAFALLEGQKNDSKKRFHPLNRVKAIMEVASAMERELVEEKLMNTEDRVEPTTMVVGGEKAARLREVFGQIKAMEAHNAFVVMKHDQFAARKEMDAKGAYALLRSTDKDVADELERRMGRAHRAFPGKTMAIVDYEDMKAQWPDMKKDLLQEWEDAVRTADKVAGGRTRRAK